MAARSRCSEWCLVCLQPGSRHPRQPQWNSTPPSPLPKKPSCWLLWRAVPRALLFTAPLRPLHLQAWCPLRCLPSSSFQQGTAHQLAWFPSSTSLLNDLKLWDLVHTQLMSSCASVMPYGLDACLLEDTAEACTAET